MYADAEIDTGSPEAVLAVPDSAVIDSGSRQVVLVDKGEGRFEPREVKLGRRGDGYVEIREGIAEGDNGRDLSQFPDRCRKQSEGGAEGLCRGSPAMIARLIAWSARNLLLVFFGTALRRRRRHLCARASAARRHSRPLRHAGHRLHGVSGPGAAGDRGPGHLSADHGDADGAAARRWCAASPSSASRSSTSSSRTAPTSIGRAAACSNISTARRARLPAGVTPTLGPDATGVGWVYQYAVMSQGAIARRPALAAGLDVRFALAKAEGVAEVASVGGFVKQYNVVVDPQRLRDLGIHACQRCATPSAPATWMSAAAPSSCPSLNSSCAAAATCKSITDLANIVLKTDDGTPVLLKDVARVELGPDERRGITELNGEGEVASGIVLQRFGANALDVIDNVKKRFAEIAGSLPKGVEIVAGLRPLQPDPRRDRDAEAHAARREHRRRARLHRVPAACPQRAGRHPDAAGRRADGVRRDEAAGPRLQHHEPRRHRDRDRRDGRRGDRHDRERPQASRARAARTSRACDILIEAASEVGPALFFSLLIITVSFLPIFTLEAQEGRLFSPLAFTKTFAMAAAALLSVTLVPALMVVFVRGRIIPEHKNPINRFLIWIYRPVIQAVLRAKTLTILLALALLAVTRLAGAAARHRVHAEPQ